MVDEISELTLYDSDIRKKPWFFRKCKSRKMAEELLTNASYGEYIVRRSESQAEQLSISIKSHTKILHFKIVIKKSVVKFGNRNFKCIEDLLVYHQTEPIGAESDPQLFLKSCLSKPSSRKSSSQ
jgi:hypothetical protein